MPATVDQITKRAERAMDRLNVMKGVLRDAYDIGMPHRSGFDQAGEGGSQTTDVYDSTFMTSIVRLADDLLTGMAPPWDNWISVVPGPRVPEDARTELESELLAYTRTLRQEIDASNFYSSLHEALIDLVFGTGCLATDPADDGKGVVYASIPVHELGLEPGPRGTVGAAFRKHSTLARNVPEQWPEVTLDRLEKSPDDDVEVLVAVYQDRGFWYEDIVIEEKILASRKQYRTAPYSIARWTVMAGEVYGRGPGLEASPTAWTLNEAMRITLMSANLAILGIFTRQSDPGLMNPGTIELYPGAIIDVESNDNSAPTLRKLDLPGNFDVSAFTVDDLRSQVKRILYVDDLPNLEGPAKTATEIRERQAMIARTKGAAFGRITNELLRPVILRTVEILTEQQILPEIKIDGKIVGLQFVSPLAKQQKYQRVQDVIVWLEQVAMMAQLDPTVRALPKLVDMARDMATTLGIEGGKLRDDEEVAQVMATMAEAMAADEQGGEEVTGEGPV